MCGRYFIDGDDLPEELERILEELNRKNTPENLKTSGEIFPSDVVPVLANSRRQDVQPFAMRWGYSFPGGRPVINARAETAPDKPMFRQCLEQRRCVIPSTGFYEWAADKTKYRFRLPGEDALYMAGLYNEFAGEPRYVILTTAANESIADVHNRMPVVLPRARIAEWIGGLGAAMEILRAVPPMLERTAS